MFTQNKCARFNDVIWFTAIKARLKMNNRSQINGIYRRTPIHGHEYTKYKMYLSIMTVIKQHLSNVWNLIHEKVKLRKRRLSWKKAMLVKKSVYLDFCYTLATRRKLNLHKPNQKLIRNQDVKTWKPVMLMDYGILWNILQNF